ncbi:MAG TPA: hypothetical protein VFX41_11495 [Actinomycetales bacterium]|nr:hypothetical protein [Actinomycetales bacterium]
MGIAALVAWVVTAGGGFIMLARWISRGGLRQQAGGATRFPAALVFGHFGLAATGLVLWIIYLVLDADALTWVAVVLLVVVALLGFTLFSRWLPSRRGTATTVGAAASSYGAGSRSAGEVAGDPAERHLPVPVVAAHGVFAVITLVLVLLTALGIGS